MIASLRAVSGSAAHWRHAGTTRLRFAAQLPPLPEAWAEVRVSCSIRHSTRVADRTSDRTESCQQAGQQQRHGRAETAHAYASSVFCTNRAEHAANNRLWVELAGPQWAARADQCEPLWPASVRRESRLAAAFCGAVGHAPRCSSWLSPAGQLDPCRSCQ